MGERTSHPPGTFSWTDLSTTDQNGAKAFYGELLGWQAEDIPVEEGVTYTMMRVDGNAVAAVSAMREDQRQQGVPPFWMSYVTVDDADAVAAKAGEAGGTVMAEPFDVFELGRMAVLQDPQGAVFAIWQPRQSIGAELVNAPGALTLNQLNTSDPGAAARFYSDLFGWEIEQRGDTDQPYWGIYNQGALNGGMMNLPPGGQAPPHWLVYFATEDLEGATRQIEERGGQIVLPPTPVPAGRIIVARDPQGAYFALWEGQLDP
jgi:predicted enzyme related to lactoylglutathione lyase